MLHFNRDEPQGHGLRSRGNKFLGSICSQYEEIAVSKHDDK